MCNRKHFKSSIICLLWIAVLSSAQPQRPPEQQDLEKVVIKTGEVPFDVVVRDKKGRPVKDLQASDFDIYEDGVKQELNSFRLITMGSVSRAAISGGDAKKSETQSGDTTGPTVA